MRKFKKDDRIMVEVQGKWKKGRFVKRNTGKRGVGRFTRSGGDYFQVRLDCHHMEDTITVHKDRVRKYTPLEGVVSWSENFKESNIKEMMRLLGRAVTALVPPTVLSFSGVRPPDDKNDCIVLGNTGLHIGYGWSDVEVSSLAGKEFVEKVGWWLVRDIEIPGTRDYPPDGDTVDIGFTDKNDKIVQMTVSTILNDMQSGFWQAHAEDELERYEEYSDLQHQSL